MPCNVLYCSASQLMKHAHLTCFVGNPAVGHVKLLHKFTSKIMNFIRQFRKINVQCLTVILGSDEYYMHTYCTYLTDSTNSRVYLNRRKEKQMK